MSRVFGITNAAGTDSVNAVVLNTVSKQVKPEIAEARDADGKVTDRKAYSKTTTISVAGLVDGTGSPEGGEVVQIGGKDYMVEDSTISAKNTDYQQYAGTMVNKDDADCTAYVS